MRSIASSVGPRRAARRLRRRIRAGVVALALAGVAATGAVAVVPAQAATGIALTTIGGDAQISAAWPAVPGATAYRVHWGVGAQLNRTITTGATSLRIPGVTNLKTYSVRVTAVGATASSTRRSVRPVPYVPTSITSVRATPAGANRIRVSWTGGGQARSVAVIAGADSMTTTHRFSTAWMPAAVRSTTLTIPASLRGVLGAGTGNVVFVKVAESNSRLADPTKHLTFSLADKYRLTPSGTWSLAGAAAVSGARSTLSVASWNVQSISASAGFSDQNRWENRKSRVVANILDTHPDLIGLQELTTARLDPGCLNRSAGTYSCTEQYQTLQSALAGTSPSYRNARTDANAWVYAQPDSAYVDSALFYNPARLKVLASGFISPRALLGSRWTGTDEAGMWAEFGVLDTSGNVVRRFVAASIHLPAGNDGALRAAEATAVAGFMDGKARQPDGTSLPIVTVGDFNANGALDASAGSLRFIADGYIDAAATTNRTNLRYSTSNATNGTGGADSGYPVHAVAHPYPTSRIDYIMLKNSPFVSRYQNLVRLTGGDFDPAYQGSDHDMQLATIGIGDPVR